jgi:hypothetical protein
MRAPNPPILQQTKELGFQNNFQCQIRLGGSLKSIKSKFLLDVNFRPTMHQVAIPVVILVKAKVKTVLLNLSLKVIVLIRL